MFKNLFKKIFSMLLIRRYSIEMHYRNDTSKDPYLLTLPGCTSACPLEKFAELVSPVITENWSKECGKKDKTKGSVRALLHVFYISHGGRNCINGSKLCIFHTTDRFPFNKHAPALLWTGKANRN